MANRTIRISVRLSEDELRRLNTKMSELGIRNRSIYIRKMILDGYCIHLDTGPLKEMVHLLRTCSNNLNQYAKHANGYGEVYKKDIKNVKRRLDDLWERAGDILSLFSSIR